MLEKQKKTNQRILLGAGLSVATASFFEQDANAQASAGITQMQTDATAISGLATTIQPIAVGVIVFAAAALLFKRYLYS